MNTIFTAVGAWTQVIVVLFVMAELVVLATAVMWRRRGEAAMRGHDYELGGQYVEEMSSIMNIAGYIAVLPALHGLTILMSLALTGTTRLSADMAELTNAVTTGLIGITLLAVTIQLAEVKFRRYIAGAERALDAHRKGADSCCTSSL